ncbi:MAG TPA: M48 family metallopeptidase [Sphingomicrobium sp.]|nr:M48 family metallopeptidase [Sphingomicrobium sp.]
MIDAKLYDGVTAHSHDVAVNIGEDGLELAQPGGWSERVDAGLLRRLHGEPTTIRLARTDNVGWRLLLPAGASAQVEMLLGKEERYGRWIDRIGLLPALLVGAMLTATVVAVGFVAPHWLAPHVPMSWERNVGHAIVGDFGDLRCRDAKGQKALEALIERVAPGATTGPDAIKVAALNVPMFNAAALPGGNIVVFRPAITETDPESLAGILAHEVAHVRRRHVTEALIRELGIGSLIRLFAGNLGANAEQLVALSYTRSNEAQADSDAIAMLRRARISPLPTAKLFERLAQEREQGLATSAEFLQSHPLSKGRADKFAASYDRKAKYRDPLGRDQADALFDICRMVARK